MAVTGVDGVGRRPYSVIRASKTAARAVSNPCRSNNTTVASSDWVQPGASGLAPASVEPRNSGGMLWSSRPSATGGFNEIASLQAMK